MPVAIVPMGTSVVAASAVGPVAAPFIRRMNAVMFWYSSAPSVAPQGGIDVRM
jgi:hypothetical protein